MDLNLQKSESFNDYQDYEYDYEYNEEEVNNNNKNEDENVAFIQEEDILVEREKLILEATEKLFL